MSLYCLLIYEACWLNYTKIHSSFEIQGFYNTSSLEPEHALDELGHPH